MVSPKAVHVPDFIASTVGMSHMLYTYMYLRMKNIYES